MLKYGFSILISLGLITASTSIAFAHGGHKKPAVEMEAPAADSIYAVQEDTGASSKDDEMQMMDHDAMGSMDHKMPEVEIAKREWVSPKSKGYGVAVGITIFAGLIFGVLQFKRPNE